MKNTNKFTIHAVFPNFYDESRVSYTLKSLLDVIKEPAVGTIIYVIAKAENIVAKNVKAIFPRRFLRFTMRFAGKSEVVHKRIYKLYKKDIKQGDIVYFWISNPVRLSEELKSRGILVVREMINCTLAMRKQELQKAYDLLGCPKDMEYISESDIEEQQSELLAADMVFCPNKKVLESVLDYGVPKENCFSTSYGWAPERFNAYPSNLDRVEGLNVLFVGTVDVRKGASCLLEAWGKAAVKGRLVFAGQVDHLISEKCAYLLDRPDVVSLGHVKDMEAVYRSADVFCFLSWEEGGPMVTIEAIGCGLACIVTPMGSAGVVSDNENGFIVEPGDITSTAEAIQRLAQNPALLEQFKNKSKKVAENFTWERVGDARFKAIKAARQKLLHKL